MATHERMKRLALLPARYPDPAPGAEWPQEVLVPQGFRRGSRAVWQLITD